MSTVLTIGTFDIPHIGHAYLLKQCERLGDHVIVGVNTDRFVNAYKGALPTFNDAERSGMISAMGYEVRSNDGSGRELIQEVKPDVLAIGMDWLMRSYTMQINVSDAELSAWGITLAFVPTLGGTEKLGSTQIRERLR